MDNWDTARLVADDKRYVWHPFALVRDSLGREYIDGNSSIWTNLHGHNHPRINAAIRAQLERVAHIPDEVMTGFGRTGKMFACEHEGIQPGIYVFAKDLTGCYLPLALTSISDQVFEPLSALAESIQSVFEPGQTAARTPVAAG